jgi:hypothetical protein
MRLSKAQRRLLRTIAFGRYLGESRFGSYGCFASVRTSTLTSRDDLIVAIAAFPIPGQVKTMCVFTSTELGRFVAEGGRIR